MATARTAASQASHWRLILDQPYITDEILQHEYQGSGTSEDPYVVEWLPDDPRNPMLMPLWKKWVITAVAAFGTLAVSFASTAFSGAVPQVSEAFGVSDEVSTLTISLFVLGFAIGPMVWAPLAELYGRQLLWFCTFGLMTLFGAVSCASTNVATLIALRALAGAIGASSIANSAGVVSDIFAAKDRGLGMTIYCSAPFLGPTIGPIAGNFLAESTGWVYVDAMTVILGALCWIGGALIIPETYSPRLLQRRASKLSQLSGKDYRSRVEVDKGRKTPRIVFQTAMVRPWKLLFNEPIVFIISVYMAIVYGTLYLIFSAFPIVFESERHWSQGISGLSFISNMLGQIAALIFFPAVTDRQYRKQLAANNGYLQPEQRLPAALIGCVILPVGLFWFSWTTFPSIPWIVCMMGSAVFGYGQVMVFLALLNYIVDAYTIYAGSAMAANAVFRAIFAAVFPLFTSYMYANLGIRWASSIPAFLALACTPFPFLFYKYGYAIRKRCKYSAEAMKISEAIHKDAMRDANRETVIGDDMDSGSGVSAGSTANTSTDKNSGRDMEKGQMPQELGSAAATESVEDKQS